MSIAAPRDSRGQLLHILGVSFGIAVAIGGMIGVGILRTPSLIAAQVPAMSLVLMLWVVGALQSALEANVICELATTFPRAGGFYVYAHRAFGDIGGLVVGWTAWISRLASSAALAVAFADFLALIWPFAGHHLSAVAAAMLIAIFGFNMVGLREGRSLQQLTSLAKALALAAFCVIAFMMATPLPTFAAASLPQAGALGLLGAYQMIVGAYAGWWQPIYFAGENVDPARSIPRSMLFGVVLTAALYIGINAALLHALGPQGVAASPLPFTAVLNRLGGTVPGLLFAVTAMLTVSSATNAQVMGAPRILFALSSDRLLPRIFEP
jgi:APA family basic amino acid/polyamine antiporter